MNDFKPSDTMSTAIANIEDPAWSTCRIKLVEYSDWTCYLFGNTPNGNGMVYTPKKGYEPNWFVRGMMKLCLDCTWAKKEIK